MRKKKVDVMRPNNVWESNVIKISKDHNNYYFEVGTNITTDIAEGVALMMRMKAKWNDIVWDTKISDIDYYNIEPSKCLYWLSGGNIEWKDGENYKKYWHEVELDFQEEFGTLVISILKKSKTFKDIRSGFIKHLNLSTLYNFTIEKGIVN